MRLVHAINLLCSLFLNSLLVAVVAVCVLLCFSVFLCVCLCFCLKNTRSCIFDNDDDGNIVLSHCCVEVMSASIGDVIQPLPAFSNLSSSLSSAVSYTPVSSVSTLTSAASQPASTRRVTGRQPHPTSNSLSTADAPHPGGVPVSSAVERDSHTTLSAVTAADFDRDQFQSAATSTPLRRLDASNSNVGGGQAEMVMEVKDAASSRRGRLVQPTSSGMLKSIPAGQNDSSSTSVVHQRPSSSSQHIRSAPHRSALAANTTQATSTTGSVPVTTMNDVAPEPPSPSVLQTSKTSPLPQDSTILDAGKSVSQFIYSLRLNNSASNLLTSC